MLSSKSSLANRWLWRIVLAGVILIPLSFSAAGNDSFRLPKEIIFRLETILVVCICVILVVTKQVNAPKTWKDPGLIVPAGVVLWSFVSMLVATNRLVSLPSFLWILGWAVIFVVTASLARSRKLPAIYAALAPSVVNAFLLLLQETDVWNPFFPGKSLEHVYHSALIGNANDVGTFLVAPTVASFALIFVSRTRRLLHVAVTALLIIAAVANHTLTALIALVVGLVATVFVISKKWSALALIVAAILAVGLVAFFTPLRARYDRALRFAAGGYYDTILSGRTLPYLTSFYMFLDRPVTGVGPGCFKWEFFPYATRIRPRFSKMISGSAANFGEVHNDHLQILAETGLPGYALFVVALVGISSTSFRRSRDSSSPSERSGEEEFSRVASFPIAIAFAVLAIGQFPLELTASLSVTMYLIGLSYAWRPEIL
jgi:O-antigen ligase